MKMPTAIATAIVSSVLNRRVHDQRAASSARDSTTEASVTTMNSDGETITAKRFYRASLRAENRRAVCRQTSGGSINGTSRYSTDAAAYPGHPDDNRLLGFPSDLRPG